MINIKDKVTEIRQGNQEALVELIMARQNEYYRLAFVYLHNQDDALDALQDMIVTVYGNIHSLKCADSFYSWSKSILVNVCRKMLQKRKRVTLMADYSDKESYAQSKERDDLSLSDYKQDIEAGLRALNVYQQEAIRLRYFLDLDYESIAQLTQSPLGTVKSRISTGLVRLRELFGGDYR